MNKMQAVNNKALRRAVGTPPPYSETMEAIHQRLGIVPINTRLFKLAQKVWGRLEEVKENIIMMSRKLSKVIQQDIIIGGQECNQ